MIKQEIFNEIIRRLVNTYSPIEIYLFGSHAWGKPNKDSDLDLLIIVKDSEQEKLKRAIEGHHALFGLMVPKDIIVYTKREFELALQDKTSFSFKVKKDGKKVYAKA